MFDCEPGIAEHVMKGNQASSLKEWEVSLFLLCCSRNLGYIFELRWVSPFKTHVCSARSGLLSSYDGYIRNLNSALQDNMDASRSKV